MNKKEEKKEINPIRDFLSDVFEHHMEDDTINFSNDIFLKNEYIERTLEKYNYDYKRLMNRLTASQKPEKIRIALDDCEISPEEYYNPTANTFDTLRKYLLYGLKQEKKYSKEPTQTSSPLDDVIKDLYENHLEDATWREYDFFLDNDHIDNTLRKYHYNYARLMKRLIFSLKYEELMEALEKCNISVNEYNNPTPEVFEKLRNYIINGKNKTR